MKKFFLPLILGTIALAFVSCRAGSDDPLISFRTRNTRLIGTWGLTNINNTRLTMTGNDTSKVVVTYVSGKKFTNTFKLTNGNKQNERIDSLVYSKTLAISNDGTYTLTQVEKTLKSELGGYWYWLSSDEDKVIVSIGGVEYRLKQLSYPEITMTTYTSSVKNGTTEISNTEEKFSRQ